MKNIIAILVLFMFCGCNGKFIEKYDKLEVEAVFMHRPGDYSFLVQKGNNRLEEFKIYAWNANPVLYKDVPNDEKCWVAYEIWDVPFRGNEVKKYEIHLHSPNDINGAGWNFGKGGFGQTIKLEAEK